MARKQRQPGKAAVRSSAPATPQPRMLYLIKQVQYKTSVRLEAALQPLGITAAQFRILATLIHGEKRSSAELSRMFGVKPQTMIKQIAILESDGMIERHLAKGNKRVLEVSVTEAGRTRLRACDKAAAAVEEQIFAAFEPGDLDEYRALMMKLLAGLRRLPVAVDESALVVPGG
jgi:DNA-binding MarR family transcriptional regulator